MPNTSFFNSSFERSKEDNGEIHLHQIQGLEKLDKFSGIVAGFIIEFREVPLTVFLPISEFIRLQNETSKTNDGVYRFSLSDTGSIPVIREDSWRSSAIPN